MVREMAAPLATALVLAARGSAAGRVGGALLAAAGFAAGDANNGVASSYRAV